MTAFQGPRGTYDAFPAGSGQDREPHERPELWSFVEEVAREIFRRYRYDELRVPVFEEADLFSKSAGEGSDIVVQKEMFTFTDNGGRALALRPEGTPGIIRAYIEHGLYKLAQPMKLWYMGPMFRQERQQRGRYRQHSQIGVEVLGSEDPLTDVEVIALLYDIHRAVGVREEVVYVNNLGDMETRRRYVPELKNYLRKHTADLDPESVARLETNPLRTFDSKIESTQAGARRSAADRGLSQRRGERPSGGGQGRSRGLVHPLRVGRAARAWPRLLHLDGVRGQERGARGAEYGGSGWEVRRPYRGSRWP